MVQGVPGDATGGLEHGAPCLEQAKKCHAHLVRVRTVRTLAAKSALVLSTPPSEFAKYADLATKSVQTGLLALLPSNAKVAQSVRRTDALCKVIAVPVN